MEDGTVKWFDIHKGFGLIQPICGGHDVFVHISAVKLSGMDILHEGQKVSYQLMIDGQSGKSSAEKLEIA